MINSRLWAMDLATQVKVFVAVLLTLAIWQFSVHTFAGQAHAQEIVQTATTAGTNAQEPAQLQQQSFIERWRHAKFLSIVDTPEKIAHTRNDLFCLAKNIYHEAGNQTRLGKFAVAQVTINRMKHPEFGDTVCGVVFEPYQFSWANNHRLRWTTPKESETWEESKEIAKETLDQGYRIKGMQDAIFYHANYVNPGWRGVDRLVQIGAHIFYTQA